MCVKTLIARLGLGIITANTTHGRAPYTAYEKGQAQGATMGENIEKYEKTWGSE